MATSFSACACDAGVVSVAPVGTGRASVEAGGARISSLFETLFCRRVVPAYLVSKVLGATVVRFAAEKGIAC